MRAVIRIQELTIRILTWSCLRPDASVCVATLNYLRQHVALSTLTALKTTLQLASLTNNVGEDNSVS